VDEVEQVLMASGLASTRLRLEVTESTVIADIETARATLQALKERGVRLALDDFGTGYSSLNYLRLLPVDTLKIDRAFVSVLPEDRGTVAITAAVVALSRALGMVITAEGVETAEQLACLRSLHCDRGQGYLFAPPQDAAVIADMLGRAARAARL
jgi:EAL domain-containing protein (putative c-di-GMP-specific phosphodiesterase class I)